MSDRGFLLLEVLVTIAILSIVIVSFFGVIGTALRISEKGRGIALAAADYDRLVFELESGLRPDLAGYGGSGEGEGGCRYQLEAETSRDLYSQLKGQISWKNGTEALGLDLIVSEAGAV